MTPSNDVVVLNQVLEGVVVGQHRTTRCPVVKSHVFLNDVPCHCHVVVDRLDDDTLVVPASTSTTTCPVVAAVGVDVVSAAVLL